ncbi:hypothetical protein B0H14DRAFT_3482763 [Mycena olivaceomarginata]|nr:hypothetical protein B0H14DRAFT_3482763 [Mycena olivaceomarginata]
MSSLIHSPVDVATYLSFDAALRFPQTLQDVDCYIHRFMSFLGQTDHGVGYRSIRCWADSSLHTPNGSPSRSCSARGTPLHGSAKKRPSPAAWATTPPPPTLHAYRSTSRVARRKKWDSGGWSHFPSHPNDTHAAGGGARALRAGAPEWVDELDDERVVFGVDGVVRGQ